jgi:hypothetical protein
MTRRSGTMVLAALAVLGGVSVAEAGPLLDRWHYGPHYGSGFSPHIGTRLSGIFKRKGFAPYHIPAIMTEDPPLAVVPAPTPAPTGTLPAGPLPGVDPPPPSR